MPAAPTSQAATEGNAAAPVKVEITELDFEADVVPSEGACAVVDRLETGGGGAEDEGARGIDDGT